MWEQYNQYKSIHKQLFISAIFSRSCCIDWMPFTCKKLNSAALSCKARILPVRVRGVFNKLLKEIKARITRLYRWSKAETENHKRSKAA